MPESLSNESAAWNDREATADTVLREGDVVAVVGAREVLVKALGAAKRSTTRNC